LKTEQTEETRRCSTERNFRNFGIGNITRFNKTNSNKATPIIVTSLRETLYHTLLLTFQGSVI